MDMLKIIVLLSALSLGHGWDYDTEQVDPWDQATLIDYPLCPDNLTTVSIFPSQTNCSLFYICYQRNLTELMCDFGEEFDPELLRCSPISSTGCNSQLTTPRPEFSCPTNDSSVSFYADFYDCTKFHICFKGVLSSYYCQNNYEFDEEQQNCVPLSDNGCSATNPSPTTPIPPFSCPSNESTLLILPDERSCEVFYLCFEGIVISELSCEPGLEFDEKLKDCVPISDTGCTADHSPTTSTVAPTRPPFKCPTSDNKVTLYGSEVDCADFHLCYLGIAYDFTCKAGFEYNSTIKGCSPISSDGCTAWKTSTVAPTTQKPFKCPNSHQITQVYPDEYDCTRYYACSGGRYWVYTCKEGYEWSTTEFTCVPIAPGGCTDLQQNLSTVSMDFTADF